MEGRPTIPTFPITKDGELLMNDKSKAEEFLKFYEQNLLQHWELIENY